MLWEYTVMDRSELTKVSEPPRIKLGEIEAIHQDCTESTTLENIPEVFDCLLCCADFAVSHDWL